MTPPVERLRKLLALATGSVGGEEARTAALACSETVQVERFSRVRGMLAEGGRTGEVAPTRGFVEKRWLGTTRPKRAPDGENNTRPWTLKELQEGWEK